MFGLPSGGCSLLGSLLGLGCLPCSGEKDKGGCRCLSMCLHSAEYMGWQVTAKASYSCRLAELQSLSVDPYHGVNDTLNLQKV